MERELQSPPVGSQSPDPRREAIEILADALVDLLMRFGKDRRRAVRRNLSDGLRDEAAVRATKPLIPVSKQAPVFSNGAGKSGRNRPGR